MDLQRHVRRKGNESEVQCLDQVDVEAEGNFVEDLGLDGECCAFDEGAVVSTCSVRSGRVKNQGSKAEQEEGAPVVGL